MPIPSNTSAATAMVLGNLPWSGVFDLLDLPAPRTLWFKYVVKFDDLLGLWNASVAGAATQPLTSTFYFVSYVGTAPSDLTVINSSTANSPQTAPLKAGTTVFISITVDVVTTGTLTSLILQFNATRQPNVPADKGSILITDDDSRFPGAIIGADGVAQHKSLVKGEDGVALRSGIVALHDNQADQIVLFNDQLTEITRVATSATGGGRNALGAIEPSEFITAQTNVLGGSPGFDGFAEVRTLNTSGTIGPTTWNVPVKTVPGTVDVLAVAMSLDRSVIYYAQSGSGRPIRRYDAVGDAPLSDFVAGVTNSTPRDVIRLQDDTILVAYFNVVTHNSLVRRYDSSATLLHEYPFSGDLDHIAANVDDPVSYIAWIQDVSAGISTFHRVRVSDGSILSSQVVPLFSSGIGLDPTATNFGISTSCPLVILQKRLAARALSFSTVPCCVPKTKCCTPRQKAKEPPGRPGPVLPPVEIGDFISACVGGGTVEGVADLSDPEHWN